MPMLALNMSMDEKLALIDTMRRVATAHGLWVVAASAPPMPVANPAEAEAHHQEMLALLHYARVGVVAAHGQL